MRSKPVTIMKLPIFKALILAFLIIMSSCSKEKIAYSTVQTGEVVKLDANSLLFTAEVTNTTDTIIEYGFKWDLQIYAGEIPRSYWISNKGRPAGNYFESEVSSSMIPGREYFVHAYAKTSKGISSGRDVEFIGGQNEPLQILDIKPDSVLLYDTIMIIGKNLGYSKNDPVVTAGSYTLTVLKATPDTIFARIPLSYKLASSSVSVQIFFDSFDISDKQIYLKPFTITSISPESVQPNTYVTLYVKNFRLNFDPMVYLSNTGLRMTISSMTNNYIKCLVPNRLGSYFIDVYVGGNLTPPPGKLTIVP